MSSQLDPAILAAITAEARQCFLDEDAPEYLEMLRSGIQDRANPDFTSLFRAAHSLKGGAGLACLTSLQQLAHKLEDVLVALQQSQIVEVELAWALVENSVDEIGFVVSQAHNVEEAIANPELIIALESLVSTVADSDQNAQEYSEQGSSDNHDFICHTLTTELASSFDAIEELELDTEPELLEPLLSGFADECGFLAQTLDLPWLGEAVAPIAKALKSDGIEALLLTKDIISQLRRKITEYLEQEASSSADLSTTQEANQSIVAKTLNEDLEELCQAIAALEMDTPEEIIKEAIAGFTDECTFLSETLELPWLTQALTPIEKLLTNCDPVEALLTVQELVGEIRQQREIYLANHVAIVELDDEPEAILSSTVIQERQADKNLNSDAQFFDCDEDHEDTSMSTVMFAPPNGAAAQDKMVAKVAEGQKPAANAQVKISLDKLESMTNNVEELILSQSRISRQQRVLNQANRRLRSLTRQFEPIREQIQDLYNQLAVGSFGNADADLAAVKNNQNGFDSLEMDRYTDLHSSLQTFQELMLQIQETRTDIDFIDRELAENIEQSEKNLDTLYSKVNDSRLVPFETLAKRFIPQIRGLSQRFDKLVDLKIEGKNTLVDQILLEQLQTPLTHLLNNAFDHGIESKYERLAAKKPETATIALNAKLQNNQLVITIKDDGGGINPEKVFQRAVQRGICPPNKSIQDFRPEEIVNWIFEPDFSTAAQVSDISGRGMGLDIVLNLIRQLRGQLFVTTDVGSGSTFTISLPLNLSLQSLMLIQLQNRLIAIPHTSILEMIPYRELDFTNDSKESLNWQGRTISLASVSSLFPCPRQPLQLAQGQVGVILETSFDPLAILVDAIAGEEKLIVKPFDETIPVPTYIVGCTILGTGEVIPVIMPQGITKDALSPISIKNGTTTVAQTASTILIAEDSVATRRMLEKLLLAAGYQVLVCRDGQEALDQIGQYQGRIDLILSDIEMPRVNGFELLEKVRAQPAFKKTPIVMATSRTGDRHRQEAERLGATDYLGKPVQPQELIDTVASLLARK
ncbi:MAG: response regulator [Hyellaceae cyanobacterium CSU_1_1]|nr:response regulator [Hyellaceae cyanobacterium CSU_1_1]